VSYKDREYSNVTRPQCSVHTLRGYFELNYVHFLFMPDNKACCCQRGAVGCECSPSRPDSERWREVPSRHGVRARGVRSPFLCHCSLKKRVPLHSAKSLATTQLHSAESMLFCTQSYTNAHRPTERRMHRPCMQFPVNTPQPLLINQPISNILKLDLVVSPKALLGRGHGMLRQ
jgi:hypothetical protein